MRMFRTGLFTLGLFLLSAGPVLAQRAYAAADPSAREPQSIMLNWGIGAIFLVGGMVVAFKPAKRSNLH
jgi:hypothetical protein